MKPTKEHELFRNDVIQLLKKHSGHLSSDHMLALSAHLVGQIIAMQDQRTMTREKALDIVMKNIEQGNMEVIQNLFKTKGEV